MLTRNGVKAMAMLFLLAAAIGDAACSRKDAQPPGEKESAAEVAAVGIETLDEAKAFADKLIAPHHFGEQFQDGWAFQEVVKGDAEEVVIGMADKSQEIGLYVWLTQRSDERAAMGRSKSLNIVCIAKNSQKLDAGQQAIADAVIKLIVGNDDGSVALKEKSGEQKDLAVLWEPEPVDPAAVDFQTGAVTVKGAGGGAREIQVLLAASEQERTLGLAGRSELGDSEGALFIYPDEGERPMMMKNVAIPLDLIYIDAKGVIADIVPNTEPGSIKMWTSPKPAMFVLEVNAGTASKGNFQIGDLVEIPEEIRQDLPKDG